MASPDRSTCGFSLIELLLVLATLAALVVVGVYQIGSRSSSTVREVMDELEGTLMAAQKVAVATGQNVTIAAQGNWDPADPLLLAYGANLTPTAVLAGAAQSAAAFRLALGQNGTSLARDHMNAGVVAASGTGNDWWGTAMGKDPAGQSNDDITTVVPFTSTTGATSVFNQILTQNNLNLFQGNQVSTATISGTNYRFNTTFWVEVVSLRGGGAVPGGAMGLLVMQANGGAVFKFYNPGVLNGNGHWRRI